MEREIPASARENPPSAPGPAGKGAAKTAELAEEGRPALSPREREGSFLIGGSLVDDEEDDEEEGEDDDDDEDG